MAKLLTADEIKARAVVFYEFDSAYFDLNIEFIQERSLRPIMTKAVYDDFMTKFIADPSFPGDPLYLEMYDSFIKDIVAFDVANYSYQKDVIENMNNQGSMTNRTEFSSSSDINRYQRVLLKNWERAFYYSKELACFLLDNEDNLPLLDSKNMVLELNARDFVKY